MERQTYRETCYLIVYVQPFLSIPETQGMGSFIFLGSVVYDTFINVFCNPALVLVCEQVKQLEEQAAAIMKAARAEISAALNKMKKETQEEVEQKLREGRKKVEAELQEALAGLERQKEETVKALDSQISALSQEIVKKVLPIR